MGIFAFCLPIFEREARNDFDVRCPRVPIAVLVGFESHLFPCDSSQYTTVEPDDVVRKAERGVVLLSGRFELGSDLASENVVADDVVGSVVLVESATLAFIDQIALQNDAGRSFVGIESPTTVIERIDVVDLVVAEGRSL